MGFIRYQRHALAASLLCLSSMSWADVDKAWDNFDRADLQMSLKEFKNSAENHEKDAAFIYGSLLLNPALPNYHVKEGLQWLKKSADQGDAKAAYNFAYYSIQEITDNNNTTLTADFKKYLQQALDAKLPEAYTFVINHGLLDPALFELNDFSDFMAFIQKAHEVQPSAITYYYLGLTALQGHMVSDELSYEPQKAAEYLEKAYELGAINTVYQLRDLYGGNIEGVDADEQKYQRYSKTYYEQFAKLNDPQLLKAKAISPLSLRSESEVDEAMQQWKMAAKSNSMNARVYAAMNGDAAVMQQYLEQALALGDESAIVALYYTAPNLTRMDHRLDALVALADSGNVEANILVAKILESLPYMIAAAESGDFESMIRLSQYYGHSSGYSKADFKSAFDWYSKLIQQFPEDGTAYGERAWLLYNDAGYRTQVLPEILADLKHAISLQPEDAQLLMRLAQVYHNETELNHEAQALMLYQQVIALNNDEFEVNSARLSQAMLLKYGQGNIAKDEAAANALFAGLIESMVDNNQALYELADSYHYGKGIEQNSEKAIELYRQSINIQDSVPLGMLLLESADPALQTEGLDQIIRVAKHQKVDEATLSLLLSWQDRSLAVQEWLLYLASAEPYYLTFDAVSLLNERDYARWQLEKNINVAQALKTLNQWVEQGDVAAIEGLLNYNGEHKNQIDQEALRLKLATVQPTDDQYQKLAEFYFHQMEYDSANEWFERIKVPTEDSEYLHTRIVAEKEYLEKIIAQAKSGDSQALETLLYLYLNHRQYQLAIEALMNWGDLTDSNMQYHWRNFVSKTSDPVLWEKIVAHLAKHMKEDPQIFAMLFASYTHVPMANVSRETMKQWLQEYAKVNPEDAEQYQEQMARFDEYLKTNDLNELAYAYEHGIGTARNQTLYLEVLAQEADQGDESAIYKMGEHYREGKVVPLDWAKAITYYQQLPEEGYYSVQELIQFYHETVQPVKQGDMAAAFRLGQYYLNDYGYSDQPEVKAEAMRLILAAAQQGNVEAQYYLSQDYRTVGLSEFQKRAWLKEAAANGYPEAQSTLANFLAITQSETAVEQAEIIALYQNAAKHIPGAKIKLLTFYYALNRVADGEALLDQFNEDEQAELYAAIASWYQYGHQSLPIDYRKAEQFYRQAYEAGNSKAGLNLVSLYLNDVLAPQPEKGMALLQEIFEDQMAESDLYGLEDTLGMVEHMIKGTGGFDPTAETQQLGLDWAEQSLTKGQVYAASMLLDHYRAQKQYAQAYFYAKLMDSWAIEDLMAQMSENEILAEDQKVLEYQRKYFNGY